MKKGTNEKELQGVIKNRLLYIMFVVQQSASKQLICRKLKEFSS